MIHVFKDSVRGFAVFGRGVRWLFAHPRYLVLLFVPVLVGLASMIAAFGLFVTHTDQIMAHLLFAKPVAELSPWYESALYVGLWLLLYVATVVLLLLTSMMLVNIVAAPFYELVSVAVEKDVTGIAPPELGIKGNLRVTLVEMKKAALILGISTILLFIPGLNVVSLILSAFLIGWNFFDYPLARRGWSLRERLVFVRREFWSVLGFGLWLIVPFIQIVMMPLAVAGGTMLGLDALQRREVAAGR